MAEHKIQSENILNVFSRTLLQLLLPQSYKTLPGERMVDLKGMSDIKNAKSAWDHVFYGAISFLCSFQAPPYRCSLNIACYP